MSRLAKAGKKQKYRKCVNALIGLRIALIVLTINTMSIVRLSKKHTIAAKTDSPRMAISVSAPLALRGMDGLTKSYLLILRRLVAKQ